VKYGLSQSEFEFLERTALAPLRMAGARLYLFGSRARGDHSRYSDVDILVAGDAPLSVLARVREEMEESLFPFKVDFVEATKLATAYATGVARDCVPL
jgi:uncharacterized protein